MPGDQFRIQVPELDNLRRDIARLDVAEIETRLEEADYDAARTVITHARRRAGTALEHSAARTLEPRRARRRAQVTMGDSRVQWAGGAEFGAYQDLRRVVKTSAYHRFQRRTARDAGRSSSRIGRSTIVRDDEDIDQVIARIEGQTLSSDGSTVSARFRASGAQQVTVAGVRRGWNQFNPWRGSGRGAGYFLYPGMRAAINDVLDIYDDAIRDIVTHEAFPD